MPNEPDMTAPVTRGEMHTALETWAGAIIDNLTAQFDAKLASLETRIFGAHETSLVSEMRALWMTYQQSVLDRMESIMEPYRSVPARVSALEEQALPERVSKLEAKVFAPKRRAKAARRTRS